MGSEEELYLREDVYFEPLFNQWYAWSYLMNPVTAARHVVNTHKRLMNSFVNNHRLHIMAVNQPGMEGGEFLDCTEAQIPAIRRLLELIDSQCFVALSDAVKSLDCLLREHTSGESLEPLYEKLPQELKGYVELYMDMEHNPSYRLIEAFLYESEYYRTDVQTASFGLLSKVGDRPFCFSTPRLADENHIQIGTDFCSDVLAELLAAREIPISAARVEAIFSSVPTSGGLNYLELFTADKPARCHRPVTEGVRLQYLGHAGLMIETAELCMLVDPVIASRGEDNADDVVSFSELPAHIDHVFITHNHQDHMCLETLLQLRHKIGQVVVPKNNGGTIVDPSLKLMLRKLEFNVVDVDELESIKVPGGRVTSIPFLGEHGDLNIRSKSAWIFEVLDRKMFVGADSSNLDMDLYRNVVRHFGDIDTIAIGMECVGAPYTWIYGALTTRLVPKKIRSSRRLNGSDADQAFRIAQIFNAKTVYLYALGLEPWYKYFMGIAYDENSRQIVETEKMIAMCESTNVSVERLYGKMECYLG